MYEWLKNKGIDKGQLYFEQHITLQLGRETIQAPQKKSGRIDVLIKSKSSEENLIVCELKAPDKPIDESVLNQAVSYARALKGNMAPIVILSNSKDIKVYCSLTKKEIRSITGEKLIAGEFLTSDENFDKLREQAIFEIAQQPYYLSSLLSKISSDEMSVLEGDVGESRKYCKELYYPLLPSLNYNKKIILITGEPQSGKTNYICDEFIKYNTNRRICIFFRSKSVVQGIQVSLRNHLIGLTDAPEERINSLIKTALHHQKMAIFIDAMNEIPISDRKKIIEELGFYINSGCQIVLTCTESFVKTLKTDLEGTEAEIFREKNRNYLDIVKMPNLSQNHLQIIEKYKSSYKTTDEPKQSLSSINSIGKYYQIKKSSPETILNNEYDIHKIHLKTKVEFITENLQRNAEQGLLKLAELLASKDGPIKERMFCLDFLNDEYALIPDIFITNGILDKNGDYIDFYEESYRDILLIDKAINQSSSPSKVIAWLSKFNNQEVSTSCITKYLSFYEIPYSYIDALSQGTKAKILDSVISYVENSNDLNERPLNLILNIIDEGIRGSYISPSLAFDHLNRFNDVIEYSKFTVYDTQIVHRILGYCCGHGNISSYSDIRNNESGMYDSNIPNKDEDPYIAIAKLALPYLLEEEVVFSYFFIDQIESFKREFDGNYLTEVTNFFSNLIEYIFNYDSYMCSYGSYVDVEVKNFKETGDAGELISAFHLVKTLRETLLPSQTFDSTLEYLEQFLSDLPNWLETLEDIDNLGLEYRYQRR